jgi:hypothetical protein
MIHKTSDSITPAAAARLAVCSMQALQLLVL